MGDGQPGVVRGELASHGRLSGVRTGGLGVLGEAEWMGTGWRIDNLESGYWMSWTLALSVGPLVVFFCDDRSSCSAESELEV